MTYEEAIEEILWVEQYGFIPDNSIIGTSRIKSAFQVAIKALEKQIPKKAYDIDYDINRETISFDCPSCLSSLYAEDELENVGYCCVCGQAIEWSDEE